MRTDDPHYHQAATPPEPAPNPRSFRPSSPLPRRLARRARRPLGLPASTVSVIPVDGGVWLDVEGRAGVWFAPDEWAGLVLTAVSVLLDVTPEAAGAPGADHLAALLDTLER